MRACQVLTRSLIDIFVLKCCAAYCSMRRCKLNQPIPIIISHITEALFSFSRRIIFLVTYLGIQIT